MMWGDSNTLRINDPKSKQACERCGSKSHLYRYNKQVLCGSHYYTTRIDTEEEESRQAGIAKERLPQVQVPAKFSRQRIENTLADIVEERMLRRQDRTGG